MDTTPTPETDAAIALANDPDGAPEVCDLCESLERRLAACREALEDLIAQRDRLAEALQPFINGWSDKSCDSIVTEQQFRDAKQALAAVKGTHP
jgi:hypothetical protein